MKPISDSRLDAFEELATDSIKQVRAFFAYQGDNASYFQKARLAIGAISAYSRIRATETNRMAVELAAASRLSPTKQLR